MPYAERSGCRLHYELSGDAALPVLVMIRGLARSKRYWGPLLPLLAPYVRLLLIDNRGVGRSGATRGPYSTRMLADDAAAVMDAAAIGRAHVFGMSLGGMIAQELALAHAERVDRLVLGCTTPGGPRAARTSLRVMSSMLAARLGRHDRLFALLASDASMAARPEIRAWWLELERTEPVPMRGLFGQIVAALRHDAFDRLEGIRQRTLVVTGDADELMSPENSRLLSAAIPNATLALIDGARHDFTTDRPKESARAILSFLGVTAS
jgi:3-oxoadipate enol-lactonase